MNITANTARLPSRLSSTAQGKPSPVKEAFIHVGREVSQEAIVGIAMAGVVTVGDSLGHPLLGRAVVAGLGAVRGYIRYRESADSLVGRGIFSSSLAATLGAGTALMTGITGNVLYGAGAGALLGLVQAPKTYRP